MQGRKDEPSTGKSSNSSSSSNIAAGFLGSACSSAASLAVGLSSFLFGFALFELEADIVTTGTISWMKRMGTGKVVFDCSGNELAAAYRGRDGAAVECFGAWSSAFAGH